MSLRKDEAPGANQGLQNNTNFANATVARPALVIRLELEERPKFWTDATSEGELVRLRDWLESHEVYRDVIQRLHDDIGQAA
jgi:hypothetical protein